MVGKPSEKEQEYFIRLEMERLKKLREEHLAKTAEEERRMRKELHFMRCAKCGQHMATTKLGEVEVDVCPDCGGMYLDAGELDKIIDEQHRGVFGSALGKLRSIWK